MSYGRPCLKILRGLSASGFKSNTISFARRGSTRPICTALHKGALQQTQCRVSRCYSTVHAAELTFGQPLSETHPHLLRPGELTPGITAQEYADRRTRLAQKLPKGAVAVVAAADILQRTGSCFYEFHQDPDFLYLTGFNEPEALAVIGQDATGRDHTFHLYLREKDPKAEMWDGARSGSQAAVDVFNADESGDIANIKRILPQVLADATQVFTDITQPDNGTSSLWRFLYGQTRRKTDFAELIDSRKIKQLRHVMNDLRAYKSPAEIDLMLRAGRASGKAHTDALRQAFTTERELDAYLRYRFVAHGCDTLAYEPVVAGGKHGLGIHYIRNDDVLHDDQMVLIDAAGKKGGYISDITRTWPVKGKFSAAQRDLYQAVLNVQKTMVAMCRGSANISLDKLHTTAEGLLADQLKQIGFDMSSKAIESLFPHHISHYIGMDVHDTIGFSRKAVIREGHCITIEPGVYIPDDRTHVHFGIDVSWITLIGNAASRWCRDPQIRSDLIDMLCMYRRDEAIEAAFIWGEIALHAKSLEEQFHLEPPKSCHDIKAEDRVRINLTSFFWTEEKKVQRFQYHFYPYTEYNYRDFFVLHDTSFEGALLDEPLETELIPATDELFEEIEPPQMIMGRGFTSWLKPNSSDEYHTISDPSFFFPISRT